MRAKFIRGGDIKDNLDIGLPYKRFAVQAEKALQELAKIYGGTVTAEDPTWRGEGYVEVMIYFPKGYKMDNLKRPLERGRRYKLEYENGREKPMTYAVSIGGSDWVGYYIESVDMGKQLIEDDLYRMKINES